MIASELMSNELIVIGYLCSNLVMCFLMQSNVHVLVGDIDEEKF